MENRIEVNGVWYVREDNIEVPQEELSFEIIESRELLIETDKFVMEGSVLECDDGKTFSMPSISVQFKNDSREEEYWDNEIFLVGLSYEDDESMGQMKGEDKDVIQGGIQIAKRMAELK